VNLDIINFSYEIKISTDQGIYGDLLFQTEKTSVEILGKNNKFNPITITQRISSMGEIQQIGESVEAPDAKAPKFMWPLKKPTSITKSHASPRGEYPKVKWHKRNLADR